MLLLQQFVTGSSSYLGISAGTDYYGGNGVSIINFNGLLPALMVNLPAEYK